jgi:hypothetical protein
VRHRQPEFSCDLTHRLPRESFGAQGQLRLRRWRSRVLCHAMN